MALPADCRFSFSAAGGARGLAGSRNWRIVKFSNGELMGKKLDMRKLQNGGSSKIVKQRVCMSLTADVAGETKVKVSSHSLKTHNFKAIYT